MYFVDSWAQKYVLHYYLDFGLCNAWAQVCPIKALPCTSSARVSEILVPTP